MLCGGVDSQPRPPWTAKPAHRGTMSRIAFSQVRADGWLHASGAVDLLEDGLSLGGEEQHHLLELAEVSMH